MFCWVTQLCPTLCDPTHCCLPGSSVHGGSPGKNSGVDCHALLHGIFPTQGLNPVLLHCRWIPYHLSHQGRPRTPEWVSYPFSRRFSPARSWIRVSYFAGRFFTSWATREALVPHNTQIFFTWYVSQWLVKQLAVAFSFSDRENRDSVKKVHLYLLGENDCLGTSIIPKGQY